jgi:hypothetical protein
MAPKVFWDIVAHACKPGADDRWHDNLVRQLVRLPEEDIRDFDRRFQALLGEAYTVDLWGAAYVINGGCSDDGFYYFRCWLIGMGKKVYEAAVASPDSLADVVEPGEEYEVETYGAPGTAWTQVTGRTWEDFARLRREGRRGGPEKLRGRMWDFDDDAKVRKRLPKLAALCLE